MGVWTVVTVGEQHQAGLNNGNHLCYRLSLKIEPGNSSPRIASSKEDLAGKTLGRANLIYWSLFWIIRVSWILIAPYYGLYVSELQSELFPDAITYTSLCVTLKAIIIAWQTWKIVKISLKVSALIAWSHFYSDFRETLYGSWDADAASQLQQAPGLASWLMFLVLFVKFWLISWPMHCVVFTLLTKYHYCKLSNTDKKLWWPWKFRNTSAFGNTGGGFKNLCTRYMNAL